MDPDKAKAVLDVFDADIDRKQPADETKVTDPGILSQLNSSSNSETKVTDPGILSQLNSNQDSIPTDNSKPNVKDTIINNIIKPAASVASYIKGSIPDPSKPLLESPDRTTLALRSLANLPLGVGQAVADATGANNIADSIKNVTNKTDQLRSEYDKNNPGFADWASERAGELLPQIAQTGFVSPLFKATQGLGKIAQWAANTGIGAGIGGAFGYATPQTADTQQERQSNREENSGTGALSGGALSSVAPALIGAYKGITSRLSPVTQAAKRLQSVVGADNIDDFIKNIDTNKSIADQVPGYQATTAQLAQNPGMAALERGARAPSSGIANDIGAQDINNRSAISNTFSDINPENKVTEGAWGNIPGEAGNAADLKQQAANLMNEAENKTKLKMTNAASTAEAANNQSLDVSKKAATILPNEDTGDISSQLNEKLVPQYNNDRQVKNDLFNNIDPNGTIQIGSDKLKQALSSSLNNISSPYAKEAATPGIADEIMNLPDTISFKQLQEYRPVLSDEIQKARLSGDGLKAKVLGDLKNSLESYTSDIAESQSPEHMDASARAKNAMSFYQDTFAPKWKTGAGKQFAKGINTYNPIAPETVAGKFIKPGNAGADTLRNLNSMAEDDPTIQPIIEKYVLGDLQQQKGLIDEAGNINPDKVNDWMNKNNQTLKMNPELKQKVTEMRDSVGNAQDESNDMAQSLKQRQDIYKEQQKAINNSAMSDLIGKENVSDTVASALNSDTPVKSIKSIINIANSDESGKAMKGLQQATFDHLKDTLTNVQGKATSDATEPLSMAKLDNYLSDRNKVTALRMIIGDDGLGRLKAAKTGLQLMNTMGNFQSIPGSATSLNVSAEGLTKRMFKGAFDFITGGQGKIFNMGMLQADKALQGSIGKMMERAVIDPEYAKYLATYKAPEGKILPNINKAINSGMPQAVIGEQQSQ